MSDFIKFKMAFRDLLVIILLCIGLLLTAHQDGIIYVLNNIYLFIILTILIITNILRIVYFTIERLVFKK